MEKKSFFRWVRRGGRRECGLGDFYVFEGYVEWVYWEVMGNEVG